MRLGFRLVYKEVGGLAAGPLTKTIVNVLMSLSNDPHPTVHYNALDALQIVVDSAGLSYSPYNASTLGMLVKLYMLDTHEPEGGSAGSVNLRADLPAHQAICRVVNALIGVLGPDLQDSARVRSLIHCLLSEFSHESDPGVVIESTKALQHFNLFAAQFVDVAAWIEQLRKQLTGKQRTLKLAAITAFYQLVQREALAMSRIGGDQLVEEFYAQLDEDPSWMELAKSSPAGCKRQPIWPRADGLTCVNASCRPHPVARAHLTPLAEKLLYRAWLPCSRTKRLLLSILALTATPSNSMLPVVAVGARSCLRCAACIRSLLQFERQASLNTSAPLQAPGTKARQHRSVAC